MPFHSTTQRFSGAVAGSLLLGAHDLDTAYNYWSATTQLAHEGALRHGQT